MLFLSVKSSYHVTSYLYMVSNYFNPEIVLSDVVLWVIYVAYIPIN